MSEVPAHGVPVLAAPLVQPDRRSCGAAVLVVARMWLDADAALAILGGDRFPAEVLATHRRVTGPADARGRLQVPWPRALGTPPWAVARELAAAAASGGRRTRWRTHVVWPWSRRTAWDRVVDSVRAGRPAPVYVGGRLLPRHVLLAVSLSEEGLGIYDPAIGTVGPMTASDFTAGRLRGRWTMPWFVVAPA